MAVNMVQNELESCGRAQWKDELTCVVMQTPQHLRTNGVLALHSGEWVVESASPNFNEGEPSLLNCVSAISTWVVEMLTSTLNMLPTWSNLSRLEDKIRLLQEDLESERELRQRYRRGGNREED
ncbi:hypothetical protein ACFE04_019799 [Oxalis oulophora]